MSVFAMQNVTVLRWHEKCSKWKRFQFRFF